MTHVRILLGAVVLVAMTVACTRPDITAITEPLAPPDTLTPPTTVTTVARTTTTIDVERALIYPVDPITLEAVPGFDPIPVGDWAWGISSENGSWLALSVGHDNQNQTEMRLIDVDSWTVATTWLWSIDSPLHVTDAGTIYTINGSPPSYRLSRLVPGEVSPVAVAELPQHLFWNELHIDDGMAMVFGLVSPNDDNSGEAILVTVDLETGLTAEIPLPEVEQGTIGSLDLDEYGPATFDAYPSVIWDDDRSRVLVVNVNRDEVIEIEPDTGKVITHRFGNDTYESTPTLGGPFTIGERSAALGRPNGGVLYVATATQRYESIDDYLGSTFVPEGIEAIDTNTWEVFDHLEEPITTINISSAGDRLLATGSSYTDNPDHQAYGSSGLYIIDAVDLEVVAHHGADQPDLYYGAFSFNPGMGIGYVTSWDDLTNLSVVNLETGDIVHTRRDPEIQFFPEAGVIVDSSSGGP